MNITFQNNLIMQDNKSRLVKAYAVSQMMSPLLEKKELENQVPLTFQDSLAPIPNYPFSTFGVLTAKGEWGEKKGIAFVVENSFIFTCASNCFSHQHGEYPNITFTINSNRKHGQDTYKVSKVYIPQPYKENSQNERNAFNYSLLKIKGQPGLKDKYGMLGMNYIDNQYQRFTFIQCALDNNGSLQFVGQKIFDDSFSVCLSGSPITFQRREGSRYVAGLMIRENSNSKPFLMNFTQDTLDQLKLWVERQKGIFALRNLCPNDLDMSSLQAVERKPIKIIQISTSSLEEQQISIFFNRLPFSSSQILSIYYSQHQLQLTFLKLQIFKDLKELCLYDDKINYLGCKYIVEASLTNLRALNLDENPIGNEGCNQISQGKWPFLKRLELQGCGMSNQGLQHICRPQWPNLAILYVHNNHNKLNYGFPKVFETANFPRIEILNFSSTVNEDDYPANWNALSFLKCPPWKSLRDLLINYNPIGNKGCKMIKESGISLRNIEMRLCCIDDVGLKWLSKANMRNVITFVLASNKFGDKGCKHLSRTNMPLLQFINLENTQVCFKGLKCLFGTDWTTKAMSWALCNTEFHQGFEFAYNGRVPVQMVQ